MTNAKLPTAGWLRPLRHVGGRWPLPLVLGGLSALALGMGLSVGACEASGGSRLGDGGSGAGITNPNGGSGATLHFGGQNQGGEAPQPSVAHLDGTVYAPEGTIPISGALVYVTKVSPPAIPDGVYCDKCVDLEPGTHYAISAADGTFSVGVPSLGDWQLVVQKGAFRRVRGVFVGQEGNMSVGADVTTLPRQTIPEAGDTIPKIAVAEGAWDAIEDSLAKLGLGEVDSNGNLVTGSQPFRIYDQGQAANLLTDSSEISQYHIVFFPCTNDWLDSYASQSSVRDNLLGYMRAGGRLYVTDWSYDLLRQIYPDPIKWYNDYGGYGDAQTSGSYDAPGTAEDQGLADWLSAQGINSFSVEDNWTIIDHVETYSAPDEEDQTASLDPTVWVSGAVSGAGQRPSTVSYQYGCGRALFSTYHTEAWGSSSLATQEKVLLYIILEVGVCIGEYPPPPPT